MHKRPIPRDQVLQIIADMPPLRRENRQGTHLLGIVAIVGVVILTTSAANSRLHLTEKLLAGGLPISSNTGTIQQDKLNLHSVDHLSIPN